MPLTIQPVYHSYEKPAPILMKLNNLNDEEIESEDGMVNKSDFINQSEIKNESLVYRDKIAFPLIHIKLGLIQQFVKSLGKQGDWGG